MEVKREEYIVEEVLRTIAEHGFRITDARRSVVEALTSSVYSRTIRDIAQSVAHDEVSVYRTISLLTTLGIAEEIEGGDGGRRYALSPEAHHHHHIVCTACGFTAHVPCDRVAPKHVRHKEFSRITEHRVTYFGVCQKCV